MSNPLSIDVLFESVVLPSNEPVCCVCLVLQIIFFIKISVNMDYSSEARSENKTFKLTGSQINLTPRSDQLVFGSFSYRNRPCSASQSCRTHIENKTKCIRPKSAGCASLNTSKYEPLHLSHVSSDSKLSGDSSMSVSHFTDLSSKLLQNLLEPQSSRMPTFYDKSSPTEKFSKIYTDNISEDTTSEKSEKLIDSEKKNPKFLSTDHLNTDLEFQNVLNKEENHLFVKDSRNFPEVIEEKTVRFCEWPQTELTSKKFCEKCTSFRDYENTCQLNLKNKFRSSYEEMHICQRQGKASEQEEELGTQKIIDLDNQSENDLINILNSDTKVKAFKCRGRRDEEETLHENWEKSPRNHTINKFEDSTVCPNKMLVSPSMEINSMPETYVQVEDKSSEKFDNLTQSSDEEIREKLGKQDEERTKEDTKHNYMHQKIDLADSTYDEIVGLLKTLDEEDCESLNLESTEPKVEIPPAEISSPKTKIDYFGAVSSYLEEVEKSDNSFHESYASSQKWNPRHLTSPRLEELLNKNSVELAHEVFTLKIQIEDQKKGIKLLKDTLAEMKEAKKVAQLEHQEAIQKVNSEAEALVQRHQKFIKQLLNEKKNLNDTVSKLVQDLKSGEEKYKRNIKAMEEKHLIEIKRAKEAQAVADKIRREKWMENKTKKLKEMTVKGLEPELSRMAARQQEEMTELRNLHKAELEAVELRAARRTSELMDELRAELTKEKERAIAKETAALRTTMEKEFEDERNKFQIYYQNLKDRIRKQEEKLSNQEFEFQQRLLDFKQEEEKRKQKIIREHEENLEDLRRQHLVEIRNLKEAAEEEKEAAVNNCKKIQAIKFNERETELHQQYKKERDQEIEMVIETLEKESTQAQLELNTANEGKMKRLKDKMEAEIKEMEASEAALKEKLAEAKSKLAEKEDAITELNSQMRQIQTELSFLKKSCDEMSLEKTKLREIIKGEFENRISALVKEKENLEKDIAVLKELHLKELAKKDQQTVQVKHEMQKELTRVYSRIKTAVNKKEKIIESLREENEAASQRCRQLEYMLDQQRRNLLLQKENTMRKLRQKSGNLCRKVKPPVLY